MDGRSSYILTIPDERGRTGTYNLPITKGDTVQICRPTAGSDQMTRSIQVSLTGTITVNVSETPVFVVPISNTNKDSTPDLSLLQVYPNPSADYIELFLENSSLAPLEVSVYSMSGQRINRMSMSKMGRVLRTQLDVSILPQGTYLLEVHQGQARAVKKLSKLNINWANRFVSQ
ncbi:T9SS type A sorting domain-containing protein [Spirosoma telluris]|uniref:T9SS type A sorting domain-containing protein n=1 Tax=Spirosoma telluris TaxID=2183553 RepID=UPI002FC27E6C